MLGTNRYIFLVVNIALVAYLYLSPFSTKVSYSKTTDQNSFKEMFLSINKPTSNSLDSISKNNLIDSLEQKTRLWGIDLSRWQVEIDWDKVVKNNKPDFVFIKASEGVSITDRMYKEHRKNAKKHNIIQGAYHFWRFDVSGKAQASRFLKSFEYSKNDLAPVVDVEYGRRHLPAKHKVVRELEAFCTIVEDKVGMKPIIYTNGHLYDNFLADDFDDHVLWIPNYKTQPKQNWTIWQYTNKGTVYGISGKVDKNYMLTSNKVLEQIILD